MKQVTWTITENTPLTPDTYRLRLAGDTDAITAPGQFVNLKLSGFYLRRPISVCDWEPGAATLIYKVLGHGTAAMTHLPAGTELDVLTGLGNGYDTSLAGERPLLVGGGVGIPPLYGLARRLTAEHRQVTAVLGYVRYFSGGGAACAGRHRPPPHRRRQRRDLRPCHRRHGGCELHPPLYLRAGGHAPRRVAALPHRWAVQL